MSTHPFFDLFEQPLVRGPPLFQPIRRFRSKEIQVSAKLSCYEVWFVICTLSELRKFLHSSTQRRVYLVQLIGKVLMANPVAPQQDEACMEKRVVRPRKSVPQLAFGRVVSKLP